MTDPAIDPDTLSEIHYYLLGSCNTADDAIDAFSLDIDDLDLQEEMCERGIEPCQGCGWWHEAHELSDDTGDLLCEDCQAIT